MRLGRVTGMRWVGDVGGVEVGAEGDRVIGITLQGANAQVFRCGLGWAVRVFQGVGNRLGQQRVCADLDEGVVGAVGALPAEAMACWKRTGLRMLVAQCSASKIGWVCKSA